MKAVILAGGFGSRISEETLLKPKPMIEIGGRPILWHILKIYSTHGIRDFIVCCGYKGYLVKEYFANYFLHMSDVTFNMRTNQMAVHEKNAEPWTITVVDTGENTQTGGRLRRVRRYLDGGAFCFTYGDGLSDVDVTELVRFHKKKGLLATVTAVQPPGRYGALSIGNGSGRVMDFKEKPDGDGAWISGGFFVLEPGIFDFLKSDGTSWEAHVLGELTRQKQLTAFRHEGFWHAMDTLRDKNILEELWGSGHAPWKVWQ